EYHQGGQRVLFIGDEVEAKEHAREEREQEEQRLYYVALTRAKVRLYLPLVPSKLGAWTWDGGYRQLNERLKTVVGGLKDSGKQRLFKLVLSSEPPLDAQARKADQPACDLGSWRPQPWPPKDPLPAQLFAACRRTHGGYVVSSYSQMKRSKASE